MILFVTDIPARLIGPVVSGIGNFMLEFSHNLMWAIM
jgi:hypothetical protein